MRKITVSLLREHGACEEGIAKFQRIFPDGVIVTRELCIKHAQQFDWDLAARRLLTPTAWAQYLAATAEPLAQYEAAKATALAQYEAALAAARAQYLAAMASVLAQYHAAIDAAWSQYDAARAAPRAQYDAARATAFADAYITQESPDA
jgi:hypothetical protein